MIKYIELEGKVPKHNFDTFSTSHEKYKDAGIILNNKVVVVDFDHAVEVGEAISSFLHLKFIVNVVSIFITEGRKG